MKNSIIFSVLCLLLTVFSFNVNAQIKDPQALACPASDVEIVIDNIIWNATPADLQTYTDNRVDAGNEVAVGDGVSYPPMFHIVEISFDRPNNFGLVVEWTGFHTTEVVISTANYDTDIPVYIVFADDLNAGVIPIGSSGFRVFPNGTGGGVTSTVAVMGRSATYEPDANSDCIEIVATNRIGKLKNGNVCHLDDGVYQECVVPMVNDTNVSGWKVATSELSEINVYPNPVKNNLFIENNGLDVNEIVIMTLDGQILNHKTSIRRGTDRTQINTSQLDTGIYLLRVSTSTGTIVKKVVVQ